ncbi:cytochrome P450 [Lenzites betulinus]|nr:cytochrome P450 [Lenzites betulinus]
MELPSLYLSSAAALAFICIWAWSYARSVVKWRARTRGVPLPPGPTRLPLIGNLFNMPRYRPWLGFRDLTNKYGDMTYLEAIGKRVLVLGSPGLVLDLLEKRTANTSDRPPSPLIHLAGHGYNFAFMPYGSFWRRHRRAFWQQFHPVASEKYRPIQRAYARDSLAKLLEMPTELRQLIRYNFSGAIMKVAYGVDIKNVWDERIDIIDEAFIGLRELTVPIQTLLEFLPIFGRLPKWVPGLGFVRTLTRSQAPNHHLVHVEFDEAKADVEQRSARGTFVVSELLTRMANSTSEKGDLGQEDELIAKNVAAVSVEASSDTTVSTLEGFFVALALYPEVQKKAQAELDAVVGPDRLPDYNDRDKLVYVNAIIKETLRWHNVLPMITHRTVEDDEFRGCFIPAGTTILVNVWACTHDPKTYPDPDRFYPERFIKDGKLNPDVLDPASLVFGWGRRACPGRAFADTGLFIAISTALHVFELGPPLDEAGRPVKIEKEMTHGFLSYPTDVRCSAKPRSAALAALLRGSHLQDVYDETEVYEKHA